MIHLLRFWTHHLFRTLDYALGLCSKLWIIEIGRMVVCLHIISPGKIKFHSALFLARQAYWHFVVDPLNNLNLIHLNWITKTIHFLVCYTTFSQFYIGIDRSAGKLVVRINGGIKFGGAQVRCISILIKFPRDYFRQFRQLGSGKRTYIRSKVRDRCERGFVLKLWWWGCKSCDSFHEHESLLVGVLQLRWDARNSPWREMKQHGRGSVFDGTNLFYSDKKPLCGEKFKRENWCVLLCVYFRLWLNLNYIFWFLFTIQFIVTLSRSLPFPFPMEISNIYLIT